jgi:hypothetical protein
MAAQFTCVSTFQLLFSLPLLISPRKVSALFGHTTAKGTIIADAETFCSAALQEAGLSMVRGIFRRNASAEKRSVHPLHFRRSP